ncbi:MAG: peptide-methionine (S)-S-oxide reductase, partial [Shewanella sp.]
RSVVFAHNAMQRQQTAEMITHLTKAQAFDAPIVTQIDNFVAFYPAETEHHDYFALHPTQLYCQRVIQPKVEKIQRQFAQLQQ